MCCVQDECIWSWLGWLQWGWLGGFSFQRSEAPSAVWNRASLVSLKKKILQGEVQTHSAWTTGTKLLIIQSVHSNVSCTYLLYSAVESKTKKKVGRMLEEEGEREKIMYLSAKLVNKMQTELYTSALDLCKHGWAPPFHSVTLWAGRELRLLSSSNLL